MADLMLILLMCNTVIHMIQVRTFVTIKSILFTNLMFAC